MPIHPSNITAVILAGGKGRRLGGQDKGLVDYQGKPLIQHVLDKITPQVTQLCINANRNQAQYEQFGYPVISDELSDFQGPLAGFATAMQHCKTEFILTMPCDGPHLPNNYVERLIAGNTQANDETLVVAHDGERLQPVHALIPVSLLDSLLNFLQQGERKIDRWYAQHTMHKADFSDMAEVFFNINTEAQREQNASTQAQHHVQDNQHG